MEDAKFRSAHDSLDHRGQAPAFYQDLSSVDLPLSTAQRATDNECIVAFAAIVELRQHVSP